MSIRWIRLPGRNTLLLRTLSTGGWTHAIGRTGVRLADRFGVRADASRVQELVNLPKGEGTPQLEEELGEFFEVFGIRRNVGRIWGVLYLSASPRTQAEIVTQTGFSSGMVSESLRELQHWGAIRVVPVRGSRAVHYEANENLLRIVFTILQKRELMAVRNLREAMHQALEKSQGHPEVHRRLEAVELMTHLYESFTSVVGQMTRLPQRALPLAMRGLAKIPLPKFKSGEA